MCCIMFSVTCLSAPFSPTHISATEWYCTHYFSRTTKAWQTPSTLPKLHTEPRTAVLSSLTVVNLATDAHQPHYSPLMTAQRNTDLALGHRLRPIVYAPGSIPRSHNLCPGHYTRGNIILFAFTDGCQKTSHSLHTGEYHTVWRLHKVEYHTVWRLHKVEYNVWRLHKENIILFDGCQKMSPACRVTVCNLGKIFSNRDGSWSLQLIVNQAWTFSEFQTQQRHLTWDSHRCGSVILPSEGGFQQIVCNLFTIPGNTV